MGSDISTARVHTGAVAAASARDVRARAYTVGSHVVFGAGQYAPTTRHGQGLLVHELAHVAQQKGGEARLQKAPDEPAAATEAGPATDGGADAAPANWRSVLVAALRTSLELPIAANRLTESFAGGVWDQLKAEGPGAMARFGARAAAMKAGDYAQLVKGYVTGVVEGIVSPVTDLFGLAVFAEKVQNAMHELVQSAFNKLGHLGAEIDAVVASARKLAQGAGEAWDKIKKSDPKQLALTFLGLGSLPAKAEAEARKLGHSAGSAIVSSLEAPWEKDKEPEEKRDWLRSPFAAIESKAGELQKRWIGEVPWAKVGDKVGYAVGFAVIQIILFAFTEGIGNAIEQVAAALGRVAGMLGKLGKVVGTAAEFLAQIGRGVAAAEALMAKVAGALLKPLERLLEPVLGPLTEMLGGLRTLLRKLLGVAEKEATVLEDAAAKAAGAAEKHIPTPHAPAAHPPATHAPAAHPPTAHTPTAHTPTAHPPAARASTADAPVAHAPQASAPAAHAPASHPPAKATTGSHEHGTPKPAHAAGREPLAKEPVSGGHTVEVTDHGIAVCSPPPCPLLNIEYAREFAQDPALRKEFEAIEKLRRAGKSPPDVAKRAAALREELQWRRAHFGQQEPLVVAKVQGHGKGQYWQEGSPEFEKFAGRRGTPPDPRHVVLPKSQADAHFRPAGTTHDPSIKPRRSAAGTQLESGGAGRRTPHDITARTARKPTPRGVARSKDLESAAADPAAQRGFHNITRADLNQVAGYNGLIEAGERGLLRPGNVSTGGVDAITVRFGPRGEATIYLNDFTTTATSKVPKPTHANWRAELKPVIAPGRLDLGDKKLEDAVRRAAASGNVYVRVVRVEVLEEGGVVIAPSTLTRAR